MIKLNNPKPINFRRSETEFGRLEASSGSDREVLCSHVYGLFAVDGVSKAVAAQYLVEVLEAKVKRDPAFRASIRTALPRYIVEAIDHATRGVVAPGVLLGGVAGA
jgi:putative ATP-dependent endonuclease of the OLD family